MTAKPKHHVSEREQRRVLDFASKVLATLGEARWRILLQVDPAEDDTYAEVHIPPDKYAVELFLSADWHNLSEEVRRETIVHEMIHVVHRRVDQVVYDLDVHLRHDEIEERRERYGREIELMVDHLATIFAETHRLVEEWDEAWERAKK